ncbi:hypothetical protein FJY93_01810 [Candidatus Kaiserbacteria bacterium]|nr:hypothetical protein [Candidatus Kaiserbacteria bacterium]
MATRQRQKRTRVLSPILNSAARRRMRIGDHFPEAIHTYRIDREQFIIYIGGDPEAEAAEDGGESGVEYRMADRFERNLTTLSGIDPKRPILVVMASCGGDWEEGMQMAAAILTSPNPITVLAVKWPRSMTSLIPLAADRFLIRPPARYMIHRGTYGFTGLDHQAETEDTERRISRELMLLIYCSRLKEQGIHSKRSEEEIRDIVNKEMLEKIDVWKSADQAVLEGYADGVYTGDMKNLRATKVHRARRDRMMNVLRTEICFEVKTTFKKPPGA